MRSPEARPRVALVTCEAFADLYADVVKDGRFLLMELEVFEPLMFLSRHPEASGRFARALRGRLPV